MLRPVLRAARRPAFLAVLLLGGVALVLAGTAWNQARRTERLLESAEARVVVEHGPFGQALQKWNEFGIVIVPVSGRVVEVDAALSPAVDDRWVARLAGLPDLRRVRLSETRVGDEGLKHLARLPRLVELDLSGNWSITDDGLRHLRNVKQLQSLRLSGDGITDDGLRHLGSLDRLQNLWLLHSGMTDEGLRCLSALNELRDLHLGGSPVSDAGLEHLARLRNLRSLALWWTEIDGSGLAQASRVWNWMERRSMMPPWNGLPAWRPWRSCPSAIRPSVGAVSGGWRACRT